MLSSGFSVQRGGFGIKRSLVWKVSWLITWPPCVSWSGFRNCHRFVLSELRSLSKAGGKGRPPCKMSDLSKRCQVLCHWVMSPHRSCLPGEWKSQRFVSVPHIHRPLLSNSLGYSRCPFPAASCPPKLCRRQIHFHVHCRDTWLFNPLISTFISQSLYVPLKKM